MVVCSAGVIKSMELPPDFVFDRTEAGTRGENWLQTYRRKTTTTVFICVGCDGYTHLDIDLESFRKALKDTPSVLFDESMNISKAELIRGMSLVLGNSGENQVWNPATGPYGPKFHLEKMWTEFISEKPVLRLEGWYHGFERLFQPPDSEDCGVPSSYVSAAYIDTNPGAEQAKVEELYLQCETSEELEESQPSFEKMLASVRWN